MGEVETMARRAARGAGLPWDLADEVAHAVRGLCSAGVDGYAALAALLEERRARRDRNRAPVRLTDRLWSGPGGALCPIRTGASLGDVARILPADGVGMAGVMRPVLILPFVADVARTLEMPVTVSWNGGILSIGPEGLPDATSIAHLARIRQTGLHLHPGGPGLPAARPLSQADPDPAAWAALSAFATRIAPPRPEAP
jgi:hypothetical protein